MFCVISSFKQLLSSSDHKGAVFQHVSLCVCVCTCVTLKCIYSKYNNISNQFITVRIQDLKFTYEVNEKIREIVKKRSPHHHPTSTYSHHALRHSVKSHE